MTRPISMFDDRMMGIANAIAAAHVKRHWFEGLHSLTARRIRLRSDIYEALLYISRGDFGG